MNYNDLLTELAVIEAFIAKFKDGNGTNEELNELIEQRDYIIEQISKSQIQD